MTCRSPIYNLAASLAAECRRDWDLYLLEREERAAAACRDHVVNERGRARGVSLYQMFAAPGHAARFSAYASEELREHIEEHPLLTRNAFESQWLKAHHYGAPAPREERTMTAELEEACHAAPAS